MFKILLVVFVIYLIVGVVVELTSKERKDRKVKFDLEAAKRIIRWPWIVFKL